MSDVKIKMTMDLVTEDRGDHWAVRFEQLGVTVFGPSLEDAQDRARQMLKFVVETFEKHFSLEDFRAYLDAHGVLHSSAALPSDSGAMNRTRREEVFAFA